MLPLYSFTFILLVVCAVFFYRAGEFEGSSGVLWAALSASISVVVWRWLHGGFLIILLGQVAPLRRDYPLSLTQKGLRQLRPYSAEVSSPGFG